MGARIPLCFFWAVVVQGVFGVLEGRDAPRAGKGCVPRWVAENLKGDMGWSVRSREKEEGECRADRLRFPGTELSALGTRCSASETARIKRLHRAPCVDRPESPVGGELAHSCVCPWLPGCRRCTSVARWNRNPDRLSAKIALLSSTRKVVFKYSS